MCAGASLSFQWRQGGRERDRGDRFSTVLDGETPIEEPIQGDTPSGMCINP